MYCQLWAAIRHLFLRAPWLARPLARPGGRPPDLRAIIVANILRIFTSRCLRIFLGS